MWNKDDVIDFILAVFVLFPLGLIMFTACLPMIRHIRDAFL